MQHIRRAALVIGLVITVVALGIIFRETTEKRRLTMDNAPTASVFSLTSPVFANNQPIPALYTCKGQNSRPPLLIHDVPSGAKSLAIIMHDPDAPGGDWVHWTIWNVSPSATAIDEKAFPQGAVEGMTSFNKPGYGGPCPPAGSGAHHYVFDLYALDRSLELPSNAEHSHLQTAMKGHVIAHGSLTGIFKAD